MTATQRLGEGLADVKRRAVALAFAVDAVGGGGRVCACDDQRGRGRERLFEEEIVGGGLFLGRRVETLVCGTHAEHLLSVITALQTLVPLKNSNIYVRTCMNSKSLNQQCLYTDSVTVTKQSQELLFEMLGS